MKRIHVGLLVGSLVASAAIALVPHGALAQTPGQIEWQHQFDHSGGMDTVAGMGLRGSKIVLVAGTGPSVPGGTIDTWIVRAYDVKKDGLLIWETSEVNPDGEVTVSGVSASGNRLIVAGSREVVGGHHRMLVRAYDTRTGADLWEDEVDIGTDDGRANAAFIKGKKAWVIGKQTDAGTNKTKWWLRYYDAKFGTLTFEDVPAGETDDPRGATHLYLQGSTLVVGGIAEDGGGTTDWRMRGYKTKDHSLLWEDTYDSTHGDDVIAGLKGMGKRFIIGGTVAKVGGTQMYIRTIETKTGDFLWEATVDEGTENNASSVVGHGPCMFIGGEVDGDYLVRGYATITGDNMWTDIVDNGGFESVNAMATFGSKTVFAGGSLSDGGAAKDYFIKNYDFHTGTLVWQRVQEIDGDEEIVGILTKGKAVLTIANTDMAGTDQDWVITNHLRQ